jgi:hypothetical protein
LFPTENQKIKNPTHSALVAKQAGSFRVLVVGKVYFLCFEVRLFGFFSHLRPPLNRIAPAYAEASADKQGEEGKINACS